MRKFADSEVIGHAQNWHAPTATSRLRSSRRMAELGVFGLTSPRNRRHGLGKESMCVSRRSCRAVYIGVGSLGNPFGDRRRAYPGRRHRSAEAAWLPKLASGEVLPTAVFTEPTPDRSRLAEDASDALRRVYKVNGNKTWITHPVRPEPDDSSGPHQSHEKGYRGLFHAVAEKPRGRR